MTSPNFYGNVGRNQTYEIGGLDTDSSITGGNLRGNTIRKVGTGNLTLDVANVGKVIFTEGTLTLGEGYPAEIEITGSNCITCSVPSSVSIETQFTLNNFSGTFVLMGGGVLATANAITMTGDSKVSVLKGSFVAAAGSTVLVDPDTTILMGAAGSRQIAKSRTVYMWTGDAKNDNNWSTLGNWKLDGVVPTDYPHGEDVEVEFPSLNTDGKVNVTLDKSVAIYDLSVWPDVVLTSDSGVTLTLENITGNGTLALGDNITLATPAEDNSTLEIDVALRIDAAKATPAILKGADQKDCKIILKGALSGSGTIRFDKSTVAGRNSFLRVYSDCTAFEGDFLICEGAYVHWDSGFSSPLGHWVLEGTGNNCSTSGDYCYAMTQSSSFEFGSFEGNYTSRGTASSSSSTKITLGGRNSDFALGGLFKPSNNSDFVRRDYIVKTGTGTMTFTGTGTRSWTLQNGTFYACADTNNVYALPAQGIEFEGGVLRVGEVMKTTDFSAIITNSSAAIKVAVDAAVTNTWATDFGASGRKNTTAQLEKSGEGTLKITSAQSWSTTPVYTVSAGDLILPSGTSYTLGNFTTNDVTYTEGIRLISIPTNITAGTSREIFAESAEEASNLVSQITFELSAEATAVGQQLSYFTTNITQAASTGGTIRFVVSSELNPDVVDPISATTTMTGTTENNKSVVTVMPGNVKKGLYYRLVAKGASQSEYAADSEKGDYTLATDENINSLTLTNGNTGGSGDKVIYYKVEVSDTGK